MAFNTEHHCEKLFGAATPDTRTRYFLMSALGRIPNRRLHHSTRFAQILCSEGDGCLGKVPDACAAITNDFFEKSNVHNVASFKTQSSAKEPGSTLLPWGDLLYAIQTCNLCSCRYVA